MSSVVKLWRPFADVPVRSARVSPDVRLIDVFGEDNQLTGLCRYLLWTFGIWTIGQLDAAGWSVVNGYSGKLTKKKRELFFHTIGRKSVVDSTQPSGRILLFNDAALSRHGATG